MAGRAFDGRPLSAAISPDQRVLFPEISGNTINGLGETAPRRPRPVYWQDPRSLSHGKMQSWMLRKTQERVPEVADMEGNFGGRGNKHRADKSPQPVSTDAQTLSASAKQFALSHEADRAGIARVDPNWIYEGMTVDLPWIIVLGLTMDHGELAKAPDPPSVIEVMRQYNRGTRAARALADWILGQGYDAIPHGGPTGGPILLVPPALAAGFGELGKHGSIIGRDNGASFRLAGVLTDMPLVADEPDRFGVDEFCQNCRLCTTACPPDAISDEKQMVRGETRWYVDFDRCVPYFNETSGCGICIAVCPWSRPDVGPRLLQKMLKRQGQTQSASKEDSDAT